MAKVTVELRHILALTNFELWDFDLPIDDSVWEERIKKTIEDYFYFHEIGSETPDRFKHRIRTKLQLILPYYNNLYNTTLLNVNPLINYSMDETFIEDGTEGVVSSNSSDTDIAATNSSTQTVVNASDALTSEYPQHTLITDDIPSGRSVSSSDGTNTQSDSSTNNQLSSSSANQNRTTNKNYTKRIEGLTGQSYAALILEHRESIINIEEMLIKDLKPLFILVF